MISSIISSILVLSSFSALSRESQKPIIEDPSRHIIFQGGRLGKKPWDIQSSYVPRSTFKNAVFTKLVNIDSNYRLSPGIFKSWKWNTKNKSYTFEIDTSLKFDDSRKITPTDIEFAFLKRALTSIEEITETQLFNIVGIEKLKKGDTFRSGMCAGIRILGPSTIEIHLTNENPNFLFMLGDHFPAVAPIEDFEDDYYSFNKIPRGTGNYKIVWSSKTNSSFRLKFKNKSVKSQKNFPLTVDFFTHGSAVSNNADLAAGAGTVGTKENIDYKTVFGKIPHGIKVLDFNYSHPLGRNKLFRKAVSLAINREKLYQAYPSTIPSHELIPSMYYGRANKKFEYNPKKSAEIVEKYFSKLTTKEKPIEALFHGNKGQEIKKFAIELKKQLEDVKIYVDFDGASSVYFTKEYSSKVMGTYGAVTSFTDPLAAITPYVPGNNPNQNTDVTDTISVDLYKKASLATNRDERAKIISDLSKHLMAEYRVLPLREIYPIYTTGKRIETIGEDQLFSSINFELVDIKTQ